MVRRSLKLALPVTTVTTLALLLGMGCDTNTANIQPLPAPSTPTVTVTDASTRADPGALASGDQVAGGCTKVACPKASTDVSANFAPSGSLLGFINEPVSWTFHGIDRNTANTDQQTSQRQVLVLLDKVPVGSVISPAPSSGLPSTTAKITWTPTQEEKGTLDIILRDMDRCLVSETPGYCNRYAFLDAYDTKMAAVAWEVVDRSKIQGGDTGAASAATDTGTGTSVTSSTGTSPGISTGIFTSTQTSSNGP